MKALDILLLIFIGFAAVGAVLSLVRGRKKGSCIGCSGRCEGCGGFNKE